MSHPQVCLRPSHLALLVLILVGIFALALSPQFLQVRLGALQRVLLHLVLHLVPLKCGLKQRKLGVLILASNCCLLTYLITMIENCSTKVLRGLGSSVSRVKPHWWSQFSINLLVYMCFPVTRCSQLKINMQNVQEKKTDSKEQKTYLHMEVLNGSVFKQGRWLKCCCHRMTQMHRKHLLSCIWHPCQSFCPARLLSPCGTS